MYIWKWCRCVIKMDSVVYLTRRLACCLHTTSSSSSFFSFYIFFFRVLECGQVWAAIKVISPTNAHSSSLRRPRLRTLWCALYCLTNTTRQSPTRATLLIKEAGEIKPPFLFFFFCHQSRPCFCGSPGFWIQAGQPLALLPGFQQMGLTGPLSCGQ